MKKMLLVLLVMLSVLPFTIANADMSIWLSSENLFPENAQELTLSVGTWEIGKDIPAGYYKIKTSSFCTAFMADTLNEYGKADMNLSNEYKWINHKPEFILREGFYIQIERGEITFSPITLTAEQKANKTYMHLLQCRLNAMWEAYECSEKYEWAVDIGTYTVGIDIPDGNWQIQYGDMNPHTITVTHNNTKTKCKLYSPSGSFYKHDLLTATYLHLENGATVEIESDKSWGMLIFIPESPDLFY